MIHKFLKTVNLSIEPINRVQSEEKYINRYKAGIFYGLIADVRVNPQNEKKSRFDL